MKKLLLLAVVLIVLLSIAAALRVGGRSTDDVIWGADGDDSCVKADDITDPYPQPLAKGTVDDVIWGAKSDMHIEDGDDQAYLYPNGFARGSGDGPMFFKDMFGNRSLQFASGGGGDAVKLWSGNGGMKTLWFYPNGFLDEITVGNAKALSFENISVRAKSLSFASGGIDQTAKTDMMNGGGAKTLSFAAGVQDETAKDVPNGGAKTLYFGDEGGGPCMLGKKIIFADGVRDGTFFKTTDEWIGA